MKTDLGPVVACLDGPLAGQWFTLDDWRERVGAAEYMARKGQRRAVCLDYEVETAASVVHPDARRIDKDGKPAQYADVQGQAARYRP